MDVEPKALGRDGLFLVRIPWAQTSMRNPHLVELNNAILDDVGSRLDLAQLHDRYVR